MSLLEVAEKPEREPDILIVEMPPCRMATSGFIHGNPDVDEKTHHYGITAGFAILYR